MARDLVETILNLVSSIFNFADSACKGNGDFLVWFASRRPRVQISAGPF